MIIFAETFAMQSKRFGSEPDLRNSQEIHTKTKVTNKNLKKKYKAPPPPHIQVILNTIFNVCILKNNH